MPEPRVAHALICDEIRYEPGGKVSYIGVHGGELTIGPMQRQSQRQIAVVAWLICDAEDVPSRITLRVFGPPDRRLLNANEVRPAAPPRRADSTKAFFQLMVDRLNLPLAHEGDLEVWIETEAGTLRAGRVRLRFAAQGALHPAGG